MVGLMARYRTIIAFLIAPLAIPVLLSLFLQADFSFIGFLEGIVFYSLFALPQAYLSELVLGIPAWLVFRRYGIRAWSAFAVGGALLGMTYDVAYYAARYVAAKAMAYDFIRHSLTRDLNPLTLWLAAPAGLISAILFRAIVFPRQSRENPK